MSELGSNQGQDENKNGPVFDSSKLSKEQTTEHFTNVKGAENRAKAAEREAKEAEKAANDAHKKNIREAAKMQRKTEKTPSKVSGASIRKRKWIFAIIIAVVILATIGIVYYVSNFGKSSEELAEKKVESFKESCSGETLESGYCFEAIDDLESYIRGEKNLDTKVGLLKEYEEYVMTEYGDAGRVKDFLDENISGDYTEQNKKDLCSIYKALYYKAHNWEEYVKDCEL